MTRLLIVYDIVFYNYTEIDIFLFSSMAMHAFVVSTLSLFSIGFFVNVGCLYFGPKFKNQIYPLNNPLWLPLKEFF
jgi:hypothetical protein